MPLCRISVPAHLTAAQVVTLAETLHQGLVATCGVPPADRFQLVSRFAPEAMILDPHFPNVHRSADACVLEVSLLRGRSDAQKAALYRHVVDAAVRAGFAADDLLITLTENGAMDWSMGRGESYADLAQQRGL